MQLSEEDESTWPINQALLLKFIIEWKTYQELLFAGDLEVDRTKGESILRP